jgi:hypothetical protein
MEVMEETVQNTKVTGSNFKQQQAADKKGKNPAYTGRSIGIPEVVALTLGAKQIFTDSTFVRIPSVPLEERPGVVKVARSADAAERHTYGEHLQNYQTPGHENPLNGRQINLVSQIVRRDILELPQDRLFTWMEEIIIEDAGSANISLDRITIYSCRPPELRFVPNVSIFWCCFTRNWCK